MKTPIHNRKMDLYPTRQFYPRNNGATKAIVGFLLLIPSQFATAANYISSGTIIVIAQTKHQIILAADSRSGVTTDGITIKSVDDNACKIAAFGRNVAFSAAGILGDDSKKWTAISQAVDIVTTFAQGPIGSKEGEAILHKWAASMIQRLRVFSPDQLLSYSTVNEGHIVTGVLAGLEEDKQAWLRAVIINFTNTRGLFQQSYTLTSNDPPTAYYFMGKSKIAFEFEQDKSSNRAIEEQTSWERKNLSGAALDRFKARRLVELTIMYHLNKTDVGGAVDEIELDANGVRWLHVKPNCGQMY